LKHIDINTWNRKLVFEHFKGFADPYYSFFGRYLHDCMKALNTIENLKIRILDESIVAYNVIHTSVTLMRPDKTFGFSFVKFDENLDVFISNIGIEQERINNSVELYPPEEYRLDCIHCSALPWLNFSGHKEPVSGQKDSVPKLAFSKAIEIEGKLIMNVAINANHALADGYHVSLFSEKFQEYLNHK
jgi:chloramphenicol O-acetyltransferase type A